MGYRFDGDLFDRYWTCHFVQSLPHSPASALHYPEQPVTINEEQEGEEKEDEEQEDEVTDDAKALFGSYESTREKFKQWWQRKILELLLTHRILMRHDYESKNIINEVERVLKRCKKASSDVEKTNELKLTASGSWDLGNQCKEILQDVSEDLKSTFEKLEEWNDRETKRGEEKPRWTQNDEKKYRKRIRELQTLIEKDQRRLRKLGSEVEKVQRGIETQEKQLIEERERKRADQEREAAQRDRERALREEQADRNIRWFTYVTIVFAPLSFAEGFYSMSAAPAHSLIVSPVKFCFAALAITVAIILLTIRIMPLLNRWKNEILEKKVVEKEVPEKEDDKTSWDNAMLSILRFLVNSLLYPMDVWRATSSRMTALAFSMGVIVDLIITPIFIIHWLVSLITLNFRDLYYSLNIIAEPKEEENPRSGPGRCRCWFRDTNRRGFQN
ncbi:hypothetical protein F5883DRAFT_236461 [Diaporthe sp. PMI_573]|nr:hypothetical protein F5883DRAFT_236461 [Diaporthaceae sp. PMI_573]